jgi:hypothetical protein
MSQVADAFSLRFTPGSSRADEATWALDALGLRIRSELRLVGARPDADSAASAGRRSVRLSQVDVDASRAGPGEILLERRHADSSLGMRVARVDRGYLIEAPGHGTFRVADDGSRVECDGLAEPLWRWHRPLCGQVLPLAATLQGFELFHASAVVLGGRAVGFVAESGTGKTSLAIALVARGATLVTDDVLALESTAHGVLAHPGVPTANIAAEQLALLPPSERSRLGVVIGSSDKLHVELANVSAEPWPLGAIYFLARSGRVERLAIERARPPDPRHLLAATFMPHIATRARLMTQLSTCAQIADVVPVFRLSVPARLTAAELASEVERHVKDGLAQVGRDRTRSRVTARTTT